MNLFTAGEFMLCLDLNVLDTTAGDALMLTKPHNQTGQSLSITGLFAWIQRHPSLDLIVEEAFMDYAPAARSLRKARHVAFR